MIIDIHTHLFGKGWVPRKFFHGVARFITHEFAKQGIYESNEAVGESLIEANDDPEAEGLYSNVFRIFALTRLFVQTLFTY